MENRKSISGLRKVLIGGALAVSTMLNSGCIDYSGINGAIELGMNPSPSDKILYSEDNPHNYINENSNGDLNR